jgi:phosphate uptake regulator
MPTETMTMDQIERLTRAYADARGVLSERVTELQAELDACKRAKLRGIKSALAKAAEAEAVLRAAVEAAPELFSKPKTQIFHAVKVGWVKQKGQLTWDDADAVVERIKKLYPDQAPTLLIIEERPSKAALANVPVADLKRFGVKVTEDGEKVIVKPVDDAVDKLVTALLRDAIEEVAE